MPIYEYACKQCGKLNEVFQKVSDPGPGKCEGCGADGPLERVVSRTSFVLKGGGWYSDLYGSTKKDAGSKDGGSKDAGSGASGAKPSPAPSGAAAPASPAAPSSSAAGSTSGSGGAGGSGGGSGPKMAAAAHD